MAGYRYQHNLRSSSHRFGCWVDGGRYHHGQRIETGKRFSCPRCAEQPDKVIERLIFAREKR